MVSSCPPLAAQKLPAVHGHFHSGVDIPAFLIPVFKNDDGNLYVQEIDNKFKLIGFRLIIFNEDAKNINRIDSCVCPPFPCFAYQFHNKEIHVDTRENLISMFKISDTILEKYVFAYIEILLFCGEYNK